jgi:hypothetical protein
VYFERPVRFRTCVWDGCREENCEFPLLIHRSPPAETGRTE